MSKFIKEMSFTQFSCIFVIIGLTICAILNLIEGDYLMMLADIAIVMSEILIFIYEKRIRKLEKALEEANRKDK